MLGNVADGAGASVVVVVDVVVVDVVVVDAVVVLAVVELEDELVEVVEAFAATDVLEEDDALESTIVEGAGD